MATRTAHNTCNQQQERAAQSFKRLESAAWLAAWGILWLLWLVTLLTFSRWDAAFSTSGDGAPLRAAGAVQVFGSMAELPALLGC